MKQTKLCLIFLKQISYADFRDPGNFFFKNLLKKKTDKKPVVNKALFKEYETYAKSYFGGIDILGPPIENRDPRPEQKSCLERTIRNKISKMSYIHVYFKSFGMTKFSRNVVFGWQDLIAFFGGICGLCLGRAISVVRIKQYYLSICALSQRCLPGNVINNIPIFRI